MIKCRSKRKFGYALWLEIHAQTWPSNTCAGHAQRRINQENVSCWCFGIMRPGILAKRPWIGFTHIIVKSNILEKELGCWFVYCRKRVPGWIRLNPCGFMPNVKLLNLTENYPQKKWFPEFAPCSLILSCLSWRNPKMSPVLALAIRHIQSQSILFGQWLKKALMSQLRW